MASRNSNQAWSTSLGAGTYCRKGVSESEPNAQSVELNEGTMANIVLKIHSSSRCGAADMNDWLPHHDRLGDCRQFKK
jgi:hypothetical protein